MTGILGAMLGNSSGTSVVVGSAVFTVKTTIYYYGYDISSTLTVGNFGSIVNGIFKGAIVKGIYSTSPGTAGNATSYTTVFDGNRAAGFFNSLSIDGTPVTGTLGSPSYNSTYDETSFTISLASSTATLFGTTDGVVKPVVLG